MVLLFNLSINTSISGGETHQMEIKKSASNCECHLQYVDILRCIQIAWIRQENPCKKMFMLVPNEMPWG